MSTMRQSSNAYAQLNIFGTDIAAWSSLTAAVEKFGIKHPFNVIAPTTSTGMEEVVCSA